MLFKKFKAIFIKTIIIVIGKANGIVCFIISSYSYIKMFAHICSHKESADLVLLTYTRGLAYLIVQINNKKPTPI